MGRTAPDSVARPTTRPRQAPPRSRRKPVTRDWVARHYADEPVTLTVTQAAKITGYVPSTIRRWMRTDYFAPARRSPVGIGSTRGPVRTDRTTFITLWLNRP